MTPTAAIPPWVQAAGFATGAAAAAIAGVWLRSPATQFFTWLTVPDPSWLERLPDAVWTYAGVGAAAFLPGLLLWRKMAATTAPALPLAIGLGALTANAAYIVLIVVAVTTFESWYAVFAPVVMVFTVGWKLLLLGSLWGAIWGGLYMVGPKRPPRSGNPRGG